MTMTPEQESRLNDVRDNTVRIIETLHGEMGLVRTVKEHGRRLDEHGQVLSVLENRHDSPNANAMIEIMMRYPKTTLAFLGIVGPSIIVAIMAFITDLQARMP